MIVTIGPKSFIFCEIDDHARAMRPMPVCEIALFRSRYNESVMELVQIESAHSPRRTPAPKPEWLKARAPVGENYHDLKRLARSLGLNTVCESAHCPNIGECWHHKTATFMMLGNLCTRRCGFCAVPKGRPDPIDFDEPRRVAEAVATLGLLHAVVTSVNRDDDLLGGARAFALVIAEIRRQAPNCRVELLIQIGRAHV